MLLHVLIAMLTGWINRHREQGMAHLQEDNRLLGDVLIQLSL